MHQDKSVFLATQKKSDIDKPSEKDISEIGTIGNVF
jgi:ATP-dependent Lon protease